MKKNILTTIVLSLILWGCGPSNSSNENEGVDLDIIKIYSSSSFDSNVLLEKEKNIKIFTSQNQFDEEFENYTSVISERYDFTNGNAVLVDMGARATPSYSFKIENIKEYDEHNIVNISYSIPSVSCHSDMSVIQVVVHPYEFIYIPNKKEILISETINECL